MKLRPKPKAKRESGTSSEPSRQTVAEQASEPFTTNESSARSGERRSLNVSSIQTKIRRMLKLSTFEPETRYWLDTGNEELNAVLGSREKGLPYGRLYEIVGNESAGKTAISTFIAGLAQADGAGVGYVDLEDSADEVWAKKLGLDMNEVVLIKTKLLFKDKDETETMLEPAEKIFKEAELAMKLLQSSGCDRQFWLLDSIAYIQTEMQVEAGTEQNMRTRNDRPMFLSDALPRWAGMAANYNAMIFLINQMREKTGVYGNPEYSPGGRGLRHSVFIKAKVKRIPKPLKQQGKTIGFAGYIRNLKNKVGGGSLEQQEVGFKIYSTKNPAKVKFMPSNEVKGDEED